ncbi:hypothetical protein J1N35_024924 [Gossypium stocksii]|uniref:Uncharacterized protein n=1 Tax=Gossypium stocksii TaxID=47602 RepID=A0A9D3V5N0_9ROSI|nr:hypothetical protein J1N35_024924 [Gossypium stocksii]
MRKNLNCWRWCYSDFPTTEVTIDRGEEKNMGSVTHLKEEKGKERKIRKRKEMHSGRMVVVNGGGKETKLKIVMVQGGAKGEDERKEGEQRRGMTIKRK